MLKCISSRLPTHYVLAFSCMGCAHGGAGPRMVGVIDESPPLMQDQTADRLAATRSARDLKVLVHLRDRKADLPLLPGQTVKEGSTISLQVSVGQDAYLRVYRVDPKDALIRVFPAPTEEEVRLPANQWMRVPRGGITLARTLSEQCFLIVAHPEKGGDEDRLKKLALRAHQEEPVGPTIQAGEEPLLARSDPNVRHQYTSRPSRAKESGALMGVQEDFTQVLLRSAEALVARVTLRH